jgi:hypothetical protein
MWDAAQRADKTVQDWITEAIREKIQREHTTFEGEVMPPASETMPPTGMYVIDGPRRRPTLDEYAAALSLAEKMAQYRTGSAKGRVKGRYIRALDQILDQALPDPKPRAKKRSDTQV